MIVVDIDGVVADSEYWLIKEIEEVSGEPVKFENPRTFRFISTLSHKDLGRAINTAIIKYKDCIAPCSYMANYIALKTIEQRQGIVTFLTSRDPSTQEASEYWVNKTFPVVRSRVVSLSDNYDTKKDWMVDNGFNSIVDDRFKIANETNIPEGKTFLIERPWNIGRKEEPHVIRVKNVYEAIKNY